MEEKSLQVIVQESGIEETKAQYLLDNFQEYFAIAADWETKAKAIVVTDESQVAEMKMAREGRLFLRQKRIAVEKARKQLKEQALREGKAIDGIANVLKALIVPIEEYLDEQEHFVEIKQQAEEEARRLEAEKALREKEEAERKAKEEEQKRIVAENERLRKETEARQRQLEKERAEADERIRKEREAADAKIRKEREAAEAKLAEERRIAEAKAKKEREELEKKLAEERRLASMVTCPACGHVFSTEEKQAELVV